MRLRYATTFWSLALAAAIAAPSPQEDGIDIPKMIAALADESYATRERATRELWKAGDLALEELRKAAASDQPEVVERASDLVRKIDLGILPDSSPRIVELVNRYDRGNPTERREIISALKRERAWHQILKLYALEKHPETLGLLEDAVRGVAVDAARECLAAETPDLKGAFAFLAMARPEATELMAAAALHRVTGTLEQELEKVANPENERDHLWRYALLASAGRLEEAAEQARLAGHKQEAARLDVMMGNPLPWIKEAVPGGQVVPAMGLPTYREFVLRTWEGREIPEEIPRSLRNLARGGDEDEQAKGIRLLFLAGESKAGEKLLEDLDPIAAFYYYDSNERVEDALRVLGLDPQKPDFKSWLLKRFRKLADDEADGDELREIGLMGSFLEHRGLTQELEESFTKPLTELAAADQEIFMETVSRLFLGSSYRLPQSCVRPAVDAAAAYSGDDELRWGSMLESMFSFLESPDRQWSLLGRLDPSLNHKQRMEWLCQIFGLLPDSGNDRARFLELTWKEIDHANEADRIPLLEVLAEVNEYVEDPASVLRCAEILKAEDNLETVVQKALAYTNLKRWKEAAACWDQAVEMVRGNVGYRVRAAACHRLAGNPEAADRHEQRAELLSLGETLVQLQAGDVFAFVGDFDRASVWWNRAAAQCTRSGAFAEILGRLSDDAEARGDWTRMAATAEIQAYYFAMAGSGAFTGGTNLVVSTATQRRVDVGMARALALLGKDREQAVKEIERWSALPFADLAMADHFFAPLREAGLHELHDRIFEQMWERVSRQIAAYPGCVNSRNSAGWLASRANRRLDEAEEHLKVALAHSPRQAAYLDTMAEIHFAAGDRETAVKFSEESIQETASDIQLVRQHHRFLSGEFPPK